jgi:hypothetical protein
VLRTLKSVSKHWQAAQKTERKSESESEIAMCDRMQMYNIIWITIVRALSPLVNGSEVSQNCFDGKLLWKECVNNIASQRDIRMNFSASPFLRHYSNLSPAIRLHLYMTCIKPVICHGSVCVQLYCWFPLSFTTCFGLHGHLQVCMILHIFILIYLRILLRCSFGFLPFLRGHTLRVFHVYIKNPTHLKMAMYAETCSERQWKPPLREPQILCSYYVEVRSDSRSDGDIQGKETPDFEEGRQQSLSMLWEREQSLCLLKSHKLHKYLH